MFKYSLCTVVSVRQKCGEASRSKISRYGSASSIGLEAFQATLSVF